MPIHQLKYYSPVIFCRWAPLFALAIIFLHFMFFRAWGYPLTIAPFAVFCFIYVSYRVTLKETWLWAIFLLSLPFITLIWSLAGGQHPDITHYFRTFGLWMLASLAVLAAVKLPIVDPNVRRWRLSEVALGCLVILCTYSLVQVVAFAIWGSIIFYNPYGIHQYLGEYDVSRFAADYVIRANGLYLEPSFNAFVILSLYVICLLARYRLWITSALTLLGLFVIQSMTGMLVFIVIWFLVFLNAQFSGTALAKRGIGRIAVINLTLALAITLSGGFSGMMGLNHTNAASRFAELHKPSTSGYYRIVAPLRVLSDVLVHNPLGKPFGQIEETLSTYHLLNGTEQGRTLDNGMYLLVFYFGWLGVAFLAYLGIKLLAAIRAPGQDGLSRLILFSFIPLSFMFSGGILLPEYILLLIMILYQYRLNSLTSSPNSAHNQHHTIRND